MRRVLIVSPHFPPVNAPDHQRVRMMLPHLREIGWEATVLATDPQEIDGLPRETLLERSIPGEVEVIRTGAIPLALAARVGMRTLGLRTYLHMARAGARILKNGKFDLVFLSTTQFAVMALGPRWFKQFGVPYVLDFQDPWLAEENSGRDSSAAPGGKWKYKFSQWLAARLEPATVRICAHAICVSSAYPELLRRRYPEIEASRFSVCPFAVAEDDFQLARHADVRQTIFDPRDGKQHWVYAGVVAPAFATALRGLFGGLVEACKIQPTLRQQVVLHFVGTSYANTDRATPAVEPIAREFGMQDCVTEHVQRIPYFEALRCLLDANALLLPGSDDPSYTASKLMPCLFAQKSLLAIFHEASPVVATLRQLVAGTVVTFGDKTTPTDLGKRIYEQWFHAGTEAAGIATRESLTPFGARSMTTRITEIFEAAVSRSHPKLAAKPD